MLIDLTAPLIEAIARFESTVPGDVSELHVARLFDLALQERGYTDEKYHMGYYSTINEVYRKYDARYSDEHEKSKQKEKIHAT